MRNQEPCSVCGSKELNLIDGFYYCVECGTQDVNAREVVVNTNEVNETTMNAIFVRKRKIREDKSDAVEMSAEWTKWHAYNFMLSGMADELVSLGAALSFKLKLLWVWTRYMARFHVKEDVLSKSHLQQLYEDDSYDKQPEKPEAKELKTKSMVRFNFHSGSIDSHLLLSFLYIALNLDESDILISHIQRFIQENRLSIINCAKFVPNELEVRKIPNWGMLFTAEKKQIHYRTVTSANVIRVICRTVFTELDLGVPNMPDFRKMVDTYIKELCLPDDFKNLVFSLMQYIPCVFTQGFSSGYNETYVYDYEAIVMCYIVVALKLCFGLDDDYEFKLSDEVERINNEENRKKSYKLGNSDLTDRLFSFREWCSFLHFRKLILSKFYTPIALDNHMETDDYVFMEQIPKTSNYKPKLHEQVTMDMLQRIPIEIEPVVIPPAEFIPTLTPLATYSEVIQQYFQDPELRLVLTEDFTQYSMKYACVDLNLLSNEQNIIKGVSEDNKIVDELFYKDIIGEPKRQEKLDLKQVFVKNCANKNWLKTKPPTKYHIKKIEFESDSDGKSDLDHGYNSENLHDTKNDITVKTVDEIEISDKTADNTDLETLESWSDLFVETKPKVELMCEENLHESIFDDDFSDLIECKKEILDLDHNENLDPDHNEIHNENELSYENNIEGNYDADNVFDNEANEDDCEISFDPTTFDREITIKKLVLAACDEYKIPKPIEYNDRPRVVRKRKTDTNNEPKDAKRKKTSHPDPDARARTLKTKEELDRIMTAYYASVERQLRQKVTQTIQKSVSQTQEDDILQCGQDYPEDRLDSTQNGLDSTQNDDVDRHSEMNGSSCILQDTANNSDNEDVDIEILKENPKFDAKRHDTRQLYLKFKGEINIEQMLEKNDPEIDKIIAKQFEKREEVKKLENKDYSKKNVENPIIYEYDTSDDEPLINFAQKKNVVCKKRLIDPKIKIKTFKYWLKHYNREFFRDSKVNPAIDKELLENFPKSFQFVLNECALIIKSNPYLLYKRVIYLEKVLEEKIYMLEDT